MPRRGGAQAPSTPGWAGTARRSGSGKQAGKVYARKQWLTPRNCDTGSNLAYAGRKQCTPIDVRWPTPIPLFGGRGREAAPKACGVGVAVLPGRAGHFTRYDKNRESYQATVTIAS
jgi:hypothetical protein